MSYSGNFQLTERGISFKVATTVHRQRVWIDVAFTWETLNKMVDREREMQVVIARVVSRVVASLEGDE